MFLLGFSQRMPSVSPKPNPGGRRCRVCAEFLMFGVSTLALGQSRQGSRRLVRLIRKRQVAESFRVYLGFWARLPANTLNASKVLNKIRQGYNCMQTKTKSSAKDSYLPQWSTDIGFTMVMFGVLQRMWTSLWPLCRPWLA